MQLDKAMAAYNLAHADPICDWICEKGSYKRNYKYLKYDFEIFSSLYLKNARSGLCAFLH